MTTKLEERLSHLQRIVDDLSDVIARQDVELDRLRKQLTFLMEREREREADAGTITLGNERPPHY